MHSETPHFLTGRICLLAGMILAHICVFSQESGQDSAQQAPEAAITQIPSKELDPAGVSAKALAHFAAGVSHQRNGETALAMDQFRLAVSTDPGNAQLATRVVEKYLLLKEVEEAENLLDLILERDDAPGKAFELHGMMMLAQGQEVIAAGRFEQALRLDPSLIFSRQQIIDSRMERGDEDRCFQLIRDAVGHTTYEVDDVTALLGMYLKFLVMRPERLEDLGQSLESLIVKATEVAQEEPILELAIADLLMVSKRFEEAEKRLQELLELIPPVLMAREKLIDLYIRQNAIPEAIQELEALAALAPDNPRPLLLMGSLEAEQGHIEEAERFFRKAMAASPAFDAPYYELAALKLNGGEAKEALEVLDEARNKLPKSFLLDFYTGLATSALRQYSQSLQFLRSAEAQAEDGDSGRLTGFFYFRKGSVLERLGRFEEAEESFLKCLEKNPEDATTLNYLGYMWAEHGQKLEQASRWIERALELEPESEAILDSMGWVLFQQGKPDQALPYLEKAKARLKEPDPTILDHLGDVYQALDKPLRAREAFEQSLQIEFSDKVFEKWTQLDPDSEQAVRMPNP